MARRRSKSRHWAKRVLVALALMGLIGGGIYAVWFSPLFKIEAIDVEGAMLTDKAMIAGPVEGNMLFWKPTVDIQNLPELVSMSFEKDYKNNRILISVKEREKFLIWCLAPAEKCFWTDDKGFVFTTSPSPEGTLVVNIVRDYTKRELGVGDNVLPDELFTNLVSAISLLQDVGVPVDELRIDNLKFKEATAVTSGGPEVYFSLLFDPRFGEGVLSSLMNSSEWGRIKYVDLRVENRAYYSL